jgi:MIP family channel proteins
MTNAPKRLFAEFVGTFTLIFLGAGSILTGKADLLGIAIAHGVGIGIMVAALAGASGAHFNPAVSFALLITRRMSITDFFAYVAAQLLGATAAAAILSGIYPSAVTSATGLGTPALGGGVSTSSGLFAEIVTTFFLVFVIFGTAVDSRSTFGAAAGLPIGLAIVGGILVAGPLTGGAMNPARWFGPALVGGHWDNGWIWIAGPVIGAAIAALSYENFLKPVNASKPEKAA